MVHSTSKAIDLTFTVIRFADNEAILQSFQQKKKSINTKKKHVQSWNEKFMPVFLRLQQIIQAKEIHETVLFP